MSLRASDVAQHLSTAPADAMGAYTKEDLPHQTRLHHPAALSSLWKKEDQLLCSRVAQNWQMDSVCVKFMPSGLSFICPQNSNSTDSNFNPERKTPEELTGGDYPPRSIQPSAPAQRTTQQFLDYLPHKPICFPRGNVILCLYLATFWREHQLSHQVPISDTPA